MQSNNNFSQIWQCDRVRNNLLSQLPHEDLLSLRLVSHACSSKTAASVFGYIRVNFRSTTFTRQARLAALQRIGHHVRTFHFSMPHGNESFLPPLIDSITGETVDFVYEPYTKANKEPASRLSLPCYGSWEITDLLVRQYPPLFHAAANVPSFIRAFSTLPNLRHLVISCPSQERAQRYRRSIVDYALISVRLAVERNKLPHLRSMSLIDVHPTATLYLNPLMGFGALPNARKRWRQIRHLKMRITSTVTDGLSRQDHLKHLHAYLDLFSSDLRKLDFAWIGSRDACPITSYPSNGSDAGEGNLESTWPSFNCKMLNILEFPQLRALRITNTIAEGRGIARFISSNRSAVRNTRRLKLKFDDTTLRSGTWDEALEPLTQISGSDSWKSSSEDSSEERPCEESMEVPIMISLPRDSESELHKIWKEHFDCRSPRINHGRLGSLQRAGAKTKELLFGTEEHMRRFFSSTVLGWR